MHKRRVFTLGLCFFIFSFSNISGQSAVGINLGLNNAKFSGDQPTRGWIGLNRGFTIGGNYSYRLSQAFSLQTGINWDRITGSYHWVDTTDLEEKDSMEYEIRGVSIPLNVAVWTENGRFYVTAGIRITSPSYFKGHHTDYSVDFKDEVRKYLFSAEFSAGFIVPLGTSHLFFDLIYSQGLTDLNRRIHDFEVSKFPRTKIFSVRFQMGIRFPLGAEDRFTVTKTNKQ